MRITTLTRALFTVGNQMRFVNTKKFTSFLLLDKLRPTLFCPNILQTAFLKTLSKNSKDTQRRKQSDVKKKHKKKEPKTKYTRFNSKKDPAWLKDIHASLMNSVELPFPKVTSDRQQIDCKKLPEDPHELLSLAASIKDSPEVQLNITNSLWRKFDMLTLEDIITGGDVFYIHGCAVHCELYCNAMVQFVFENVETTIHNSITPSQMVRLLFHIQKLQVHSSVSAALVIELESNIELNLSTSYTIDELAYICQLMFYGPHRLRSMTLVDKIAGRLLQDFGSLSPHNLPMMMKAFRFSKYVKVSFYKRLGDLVISNNYLQHFSRANQLMHLAFTYASVGVTHHDLFKHLLQRTLDLEQPPRLKDISKIIWACGTLMTAQKDHLDLIHSVLDYVRSLCTVEQALEYPDNLMDFLQGLAYLDIYPLDIIERMLTPKVIKTLIGLDASRVKFLQLNFLDSSLIIDRPSFKKKLLTEADRVIVHQNMHSSVDVNVKLRRSLAPALKALRDMLGEKCVQNCFVLSHFMTSDILLNFDTHKKQFVPPPREHGERCNHVERIVIMLLSHTHTSYDNQPLGAFVCKNRQLERLGYRVVKVDSDEALNFSLMDSVIVQQRLMDHIGKVVDCY